MSISLKDRKLLVEVWERFLEIVQELDNAREKIISDETKFLLVCYQGNHLLQYI